MKTLDRILSKAGICSRTEARDWVLEGRMKVNGKVIVDPEHWVDLENDTILVDGKPLREERKIYVLLYKPKGYLTTYKDPEGRPTVYNLLYDIKQWVFPVGRLDQDTSGLLILTNDTDFAEHVTNPEHHVAKTYLVKTSSVLSDDQIESLRHGLELKDGPTRPAQVVKLRDTPAKTFFEITITEGRNRQVRRMVEALDSSVSKLVRTAIGPIRIEDLNIGSWRYLTEPEVKNLRRAGGTPKKSARREWLAFEEGELEEGVKREPITPEVEAISLLEPDDEVEFVPPAPPEEPVEVASEEPTAQD